MLRLVALVLLAAPLSRAFALQAAPRATVATTRLSTTTMGANSLSLKVKVKRAAMASKGRHRLCVFKYAPPLRSYGGRGRAVPCHARGCA